jgi:hypothetical protein
MQNGHPNRRPSLLFQLFHLLQDSQLTEAVRLRARISLISSFK